MDFYWPLFIDVLVVKHIIIMIKYNLKLYSF